MKKYVWMFGFIGLLGSILMIATGNVLTIIGYFIIYSIIIMALITYSYQETTFSAEKEHSKYQILLKHQRKFE